MDEFSRTRTLFTYGYERPPRKPDQFRALLLRASETSLVFASRLYPSGSDRHPGSVVRAGDLAVWFVHCGDAYDVARVYSPDGTFRGYYVDATAPIGWNSAEPSGLHMIDLYLDVQIHPDLSCEVLDRDELSEAVARDWITADQAELAEATVADVLRSVNDGLFPPAPVRDFVLSAADLAQVCATNFRD